MGNVYQVKGRAVQGDVYKMNPRTDDKTGQPKMNAKGEPSMQHYLALAVPKGDPTIDGLLAQLAAEHKAFWPGGQWQLPAFATKVEDGDSTTMNKKMKRNCDREGFPGNWIFKFTNGFPPAVKYWDAVGGWKDSIPGSGIGPVMKLGDFYTVIFDVEGNGSNDSPGVYLNTKTIAYEAPGEAIQSGEDYTGMLGTRGPGGAAPTPAPVAAPAAPTPVASPAPAPIASPSSAPPPYNGHMATPPAPPPAAPRFRMLKADGVTYDQYIAAGWTEQQMVDGGVIALN